jgi:predicted unusual protein kinase regulating ubiquinone biosynthesis (AarF/ABC1/UbiB family)
VPSDDNRLAALLARIAQRAAPVPTTALGRMRRTAGAALRAAASAARRGGGLAGLDEVAIERLVESLGELKGIAMKMGQILSYIDDALPPETRKLLATLQKWSPPAPFAQVRETLEEEFGPRAATLVAAMMEAPASSASIGQVHRARLEGVDLAVKIRHRGIDEAIRADFRATRAGVALARMLMPGGTVDDVVEEARTTFLEECDYSLEARRQVRFEELYRGDPDLIVPRVHHDWSSARVLTTTWHEGLGFEEYLAQDPPQRERDRVGAALYRFYLGTVYRHGLFNADPHPGNLLFADAGRVVVLDYGCVREFERQMVSRLAALSAAVRSGDEGKMREALIALGAKDPGAKRFFTAAELLRSFYGPILRPGRSRISAGIGAALREVVAKKRQVASLGLPGRLLFLFRIRFGLYAVLARIGAEVDWQALEAELVAGAPSP